MDLPRTIARVLDLPLRGTLEKRPWWEALVWPRGAGTDVLLRSHHCIADGASFGALFGNLSDQREEIDALLRQGPRRRRRGRLARLLRVVFGPLVVSLRLLRAVLASLWMVVAAPLPAAAAGPADRRVGVGLRRRRAAQARREEAGARRDRQRPLRGAGRGRAADVHFEGRGGVRRPGPPLWRRVAARCGRGQSYRRGRCAAALPGRDEAAHLRQVRDGVGGALRGGARAVVAYHAARLAGRCLPRAWVPASLRASAGGCAVALTCVEIKILRRVRAESPRRPPRHRRDACSMAWRCRFLTARWSQRGRVIAAK